MKRFLYPIVAVLLTVLLFSAWTSLKAERVAAERALRRYETVRDLAVQYTALDTTTQSTAPAQSLFALFNAQAKTAGLTSGVERLQPRPSPDGKAPERQEVRLADVYQEPVIRLLSALEQEPGVQIESLGLFRTVKGLLHVDLVLARQISQP